MNNRGQADRRLDRLLADPDLAEHLFVRLDKRSHPFIAETAGDHRSKSGFSTPGLTITFMRNHAGIELYSSEVAR